MLSVCNLKFSSRARIVSEYVYFFLFFAGKLDFSLFFFDAKEKRSNLSSGSAARGGEWVFKLVVAHSIETTDDDNNNDVDVCTMRRTKGN